MKKDGNPYPQNSPAWMLYSNMESSYFLAKAYDADEQKHRGLAEEFRLKAIALRHKIETFEEAINKLTVV